MTPAGDVSQSSEPTVEESATANPHGAKPERDPMDNPKLAAILKEYMSAVESGQRVNRQDVLAAHPDLAGELSACLQGLAFVKSAALQMENAVGTRPPVFAGIDRSELEGAQPLGDFQLIRELGRGGMGVVYEALQLSLGRHVAVKVLSMGGALDQRQLQRFKNEAQAAAQLHHTNIVPVYAVGCERSVNFYAMQLIEGQSLADIIQDLRKKKENVEVVGDGETRGSASPRSTLELRASANRSDDTEVLPQFRDGIHSVAMAKRAAANAVSGRGSGDHRLSTSFSAQRVDRRRDYYRTVARLGLQAAEALHYAHQLGIVHRDIKPANLLVDVRENLWITDFGLAQFYGETNLTCTGDLLGTFRYMSPEQASGKQSILDQRTDIYSLGVTLYELLTLQRAVPGESREELLQQISQLEPISPRLIDKYIPIELQTILSKAISKEPAERYASARALADDLQRFMRDEPIHARPPTMWDRTMKWIRRHRAIAVSIVLILFIVSAGLLVSTLLIAREQARTSAAYQLETQKATEATTERLRAEDNFQQAREAVDFFAGVADELPRDPQNDEVRQHLLEVALDYYQNFIRESGNDASVNAGLLAAETRASDILKELAALNEMNRISFSVRLLDRPEVQRELNLTEDQEDQIRQIDGQNAPRQTIDDLSKNTSEQRKELLTARAHALESKRDSILTAAQLQRLSEISRQMRGVEAFNDPDVADHLGLSPPQKEGIRKLITKTEQWRRLPGPPGKPGGGPRPRGGPDGFDRPGPPRGPDEAAAQTDGKEIMDQALSLLTADQRAAWQELIGAHFEMPMRFPPPRAAGFDGSRPQPGPPPMEQ